VSVKPPVYPEEKDNTCALACLRMILAAHGRNVDENTLERHAHMDPGGTDIGELERLARQFGLTAEVKELTVKELGQLLSEGRLAMAYLDRAVFDLTPAQRLRHSLRSAQIHVVLPTRVTVGSVTFHDPLPPGRVARRPIRLFRAAYESLGSHCVVCSKE
jgi:Peptidase C39 family